MRIGNGHDVHKLVVGRPLILGGIKIPFEFGLEGHSDGDVLAHAVTDALLGATASGDIGMWFPPEDQQYAGANSIELLKRVRFAVDERGFRIVNVDSVIICERPRLSPFFLAMREKLSEALEISPDQMSVKATSPEGLGYLGRGEAIAVSAVALIENR